VTVTRALLPFVSLTSGFAWMSAVAHFLVLIFYGQVRVLPAAPLTSRAAAVSSARVCARALRA